MDTCPKSLSKFVDSDKCQGAIDSLKTCGDDQNESERLVESFKKLIDRYQEQPELLDPYLSDLIQQLTSILNDFNISGPRYHTVFKFLYQLIKVTGFKDIAKRFPHDTQKLPTLVQLLSREDTQDKQNWQTRFVLIVWLSIVILTPFDLDKFDGANSDEQKISDKILTTLLRSLELHDSCQHVASYCLGRYFARPDIINNATQLAKFVDDSLGELKSLKDASANSFDDIKLIGYLRTLCYMFKYMPRTDSEKLSRRILPTLIEVDLERVNRGLISHLMTKLIQRAGLALLPERAASWRYKRASKFLGKFVVNDSGASLKSAASGGAKEFVEEGEQQAEVEERSFEELESVLSMLFSTAQNSSTIVRWSAAKGVARLASRLSQAKAGDVLDLVLNNFFDASSSEFAWHSGCLTLAEMSRHGTILESRLERVTQIISQAIIYDKIKGSFAVGSHIREAACYVCWAIARTYEDDLLEPHIGSISTNLLCTMLFDRELQCRRAASATFQELVGRQGTFNQDSISILTSADYQNVGQLQFTYLHLASQVANQSHQYAHSFVGHLLSKKVGHWDVQVRRLASQSLSALMIHSEGAHVKQEVLPNLLAMCNQNTDNNAKHGAILSLAQVIRGLVPLDFKFEPELVEAVANLKKGCQKQLSSKVQAPNFIEAICQIITSAELASFQFADDSQVVKEWDSVALSALDNSNPTLRDFGATALLVLYRTYYAQNKTQQDRLLSTLTKALTTSSEATRCGALKALSKLSQPRSFAPGTTIRLDADTPDIIMQTLVSYISRDTKDKQLNMVLADAKAQSCHAFVDFVKDLEKSRLIGLTALLETGFEALLASCRDYTHDRRGDIGVVVRRAAVKSLLDLSLHLLAIGLDSLITQERILRIMQAFLQQAVSYNDSARELAGLSFYQLASSPLMPDYQHKETILKLFETHVFDDFNWRDHSTPIFTSLLLVPDFAVDLWQGFFSSAGQTSEIGASQFREELRRFILKQGPQVLDSFFATLQLSEMPHRIRNSGLNVADFFMSNGLLDSPDLIKLEKILADFKNSDYAKRLEGLEQVLSSLSFHLTSESQPLED